MNLYLMRHAIAADYSEYTDDSQRPLTGKGREKLARIVQGMEKLELRFNTILASPYVRARQTAQLVAEGLKIAPQNLILTEHLAPFGSTSQLIEQINTLPASQDVLLVGHEPNLSQLIGMLLAGNDNLAIDIKKAGVCKLSMEKLIHGRCAMLCWLLTPTQLAEI